jgi:hypothetical protein
MVSAIVTVSYLVVAFAFRQEVAANWSRDWNVGGHNCIYSQISMGLCFRYLAANYP